MKKKFIFYAVLLSVVFVNANASLTHAFESSSTQRYFNGPTVSDITSTSAIVSLSRDVLSGITDPYDLNSLYFEIYRTNQVCIAIYPTPAECMPKKTAKGLTSVRINDLLPNTSYTAVYKRDNTINCITTPCPSNEFISMNTEFTTPMGNFPGAIVNPAEHKFTKGFGYRARGLDVTKLQLILIQKGFLIGTPTGYFGNGTLKAVKDFQRSIGVNPTGYLGPITRSALGGNISPNMTEETFTGRVTAVSTGCFSDGECSVTVDGKKVVTTIGWSQQIVGSVIGSSLGDIPVGAQVKVYARKTSDGYTLYGSTKYYVQLNYSR
jgi:hypothetical protein